MLGAVERWITSGSTPGFDRDNWTVREHRDVFVVSAKLDENGRVKRGAPIFMVNGDRVLSFNLAHMSLDEAYAKVTDWRLSQSI